jgi:dTDP-glucose 4,6-dehydratase
MKTYVILGGNGVFGVHCAAYLLKNADPKKVICVGRNPEKPEPFTLNLGKDDPRYLYYQIHAVYEHDRMMEMLDAERPDVIINFAAIAEPAVSFKKSWRYYDINVTALAKIAEDLMERDYLKRFIQIGTSELYGPVDTPSKESDPLKPSSPYAVSKAAGDMHLMAIHKFLNFPMNIVRPSNAYAPGQQLYRILPKSVMFGLLGRKLPLEGGGRAVKSYIHARDLARAIHLVIEKAPLGRTYNIGPKETISIRELVARTAEAMDLTLDELCDDVPDRLAQDTQYWLDSGLIKEDVGWEPEISLEEGIEEMVAWGRKYIEMIKDMPPNYTFRA